MDRQEIAVTAYPKSGITWLIFMLSDLLSSPQKAGSNMEWHGPKRGRKYFVTKNHATYNLGSDVWQYDISEDQAKELNGIVHTVRDPRDILVSLWYFQRKKSPIKDLIKSFTNEPSYPRWVGSWQNCDKVVQTRYEALQELKHHELKRIAHELVGDNVSESWAREVYNRHTISKMRRRLMKPDGPDRITRKGTVGEWRHHFTRDMAIEFHIHMGRYLEESGYIDKGEKWWEGLP